MESNIAVVGKSWPLNLALQPTAAALVAMALVAMALVAMAFGGKGIKGGG